MVGFYFVAKVVSLLLVALLRTAIAKVDNLIFAA